MPDTTDQSDLPVNESGTHVATLSPTGDPWQCPIDYLEYALKTGFTIADSKRPSAEADPGTTNAPKRPGTPPSTPTTPSTPNA